MGSIPITRFVSAISSPFASHDALAAGKLFGCYLSEIQRQGLKTCTELTSLRIYKFNNSFDCNPFPEPAAVLADMEITNEEMAYVAAERARGGLKEEQIRVIHARAFVSVLSKFAADRLIDDREVRKLRKLNGCLAKLGWAPGG